MMITKNINQTNMYTPMIEQYLLFKKKYPHMLVFFQIGDFYELFFNDAKKASELLNITLTKRGYSSHGVIPMAGIPCNYISHYAAKLIKLGISMVICDQVGHKLTNTKGLLDRKVSQVITPGTVTDENLLSDKLDNMLSAVYEKNNIFYYSNLDLSSGRFYVSEHNSKEQLLARIECTNPQEILFPSSFAFKDLIKHRHGLQSRPNSEFDVILAKKNVKCQFGSNSVTFLSISDKNGMLSVAGCLLIYIKSMHYSNFHHIRCIKIIKNKDYIYMNAATIKHLSLMNNISGKKINTLSDVLDHTVTQMGSRMFKRWLYAPLRNITMITNRHSSVVSLKKYIQPLKTLLIQVGDLERVVSRLSLRTAVPRDWVLLRLALCSLPKIRLILSEIDNKYLQSLLYSIGVFSDLLSLLHKAIAICPSVHIRDGNVIADNYNLQLDQLRSIKNSSKDVLCDIKLKESIKLGVDNLKIGCNNAIGYYIQINNKYLNLIPNNYVKKQTLKYFSRYTFPELQQFQETFLTANFRLVELETILYEGLFDVIYPYLYNLQDSARALSELDVLTNFSERSITLNYVCPILTNKREIVLKNSRHPVIELIVNEVFQDNDVELTYKKSIMVITGPNMGGKSTYMRQIALIVIMSCIGSFVPSTYARIGNIDQIFTRIGSSDNLLEGESTFMVEMRELSNILTNATTNSLVLIDEIGRGTSNYEGLSLAWSILEYFAKKICSITLFSTHYFELTELSKRFNNIHNMFFSILKKNKDIIFLYKIQSGHVNKSYALSVSELAGIPIDIIATAKNKLKQFNNKSMVDIDLLSNNKFDLVKLILSIEPNNISPREALDFIFLLKAKIEQL
ncbi:MAG: DNA mismatch repair protein MutS [Buchnera aphidicola (Eriosoma harunire)]